jgi:hypothetical protein
MRVAQTVREVSGPAPARRMLDGAYVSNKLESWTIPLHIIMWTTLLCGLIMVMVVVMMHR